MSNIMHCKNILELTLNSEEKFRNFLFWIVVQITPLQR